MNSYKLFLSAMSKTGTWACLFLAVYATLLFSSIVDWYGENHKTSSGWPAVFASVAVFGVLSMAMAVALFIGVRAFFVIWSSVLVLMVLAGKSSRRVVVEGKKVAREIAEIVFKGLLKLIFVALLCALPACFVFFNSYSSSSCP